MDTMEHLKNKKAQDIFVESWSNEFFGRSVFEPVKSKQMKLKEEIIKEENSLRHTISQNKLNVVDFFDLQNIKVSKNKFMDLQILICDDGENSIDY